MKSMTIFGIGPRWGAIVIAYGVLSTWISIRYSILRIPDQFSPAATILGIVLLVIGVPFYLVAARTIIRGFPTGQLLTKDIYGVCRHPVYGSWIVFIIPGIELILRSWLGLSTCVLGYLLLRVMAREEETYLAEKFGEKYEHYRQRTPFVLPIGFFRKRES